MGRHEREAERAQNRALVARRLLWWPDGAEARRIDQSIGWAIGSLSVLEDMRSDGLVVREADLWRPTLKLMAETRHRGMRTPPPPPKSK